MQGLYVFSLHLRPFLQVFDTPGVQRISDIPRNLFRNVHGIIVMHDVTDRKSFVVRISGYRLRHPHRPLVVHPSLVLLWVSKNLASPSLFCLVELQHVRSWLHSALEVIRREDGLSKVATLLLAGKVLGCYSPSFPHSLSPSLVSHMDTL